jgi:hypothetical protein
MKYKADFFKHSTKKSIEFDETQRDGFPKN